jgi:hypothetical protein
MREVVIEFRYGDLRYLDNPGDRLNVKHADLRFRSPPHYENGNDEDG